MANTKKDEPKAAQKEQVAFDHNKDVVLIGTGKSKHLLKGVKYTVSGADAESLVQSGKATTITDK